MTRINNKIEKLILIVINVIHHLNHQFVSAHNGDTIVPINDTLPSSGNSTDEGFWSNFEKCPCSNLACRILVTSLLLCVTMLILTVIIICTKYTNLKKTFQRSLTEPEIAEFFRNDTDDHQLHPNFFDLSWDPKFEIPMEKLSIDLDWIMEEVNLWWIHRGIYLGNFVRVKTNKLTTNLEGLQRLLVEAKTMAFLGRHENIVNFFGAATAKIDESALYVVTELSPYGPLSEYMVRNRGILLRSKRKLVRWCVQIANAMKFLESKEIIYNELSAGNVLLFENGVVKITNFTSAHFSTKNTLQGGGGGSHEFLLRSIPWAWTSLEALKFRKFSHKSDVWAFGVTVWEIFSLGQFPYNGIQFSREFVDQLSGGFRLTQPQFASNEIYEEVMTRCWDARPETRPSFNDLHTFFKDYEILEGNLSSKMDYVNFQLYEPLDFS